MATFNDTIGGGTTAGATTPSYGARKQSNPRTTVVQLGDGYEHRARIGLNINPKVWTLQWNVSEADADKIEAFFEERAVDGAFFNWTPPAGTAGKWVCPTFSKSIPYLNRATISATFREVFDVG
jgi:phage-related protein|tara:strand:+ start:258 stop:629 length:372 start_codon:yes stop_codon:yes gene_type:complete